MKPNTRKMIFGIVLTICLMALAFAEARWGYLGLDGSSP